MILVEEGDGKIVFEISFCFPSTRACLRQEGFNRAWEGPFILKSSLQGGCLPRQPALLPFIASAPRISASVSGHFDEKFSTGCFYAGFRGDGIYGISPVWTMKMAKNQIFLPGLPPLKKIRRGRSPPSSRTPVSTYPPTHPPLSLSSFIPSSKGLFNLNLPYKQNHTSWLIIY